MYVNTPKYFLSADCSFKVSERPSKFAVDDLLSAKSLSFREYLRENENFHETVFACSYWAQAEFFFIKSVVNLVTLSF